MNAEITPTSLLNGAITTYTFSITISTELKAAEKITITFPPEIIIPALQNCELTENADPKIVSFVISGCADWLDFVGMCEGRVRS